jgi:hypothetical protein
MSAADQEQMARIVVGSYPASEIKLSAKYENSKAISARIASTVSRISPPDVTSMMDKQKPQAYLPGEVVFIVQKVSDRNQFRCFGAKNASQHDILLLSIIHVSHAAASSYGTH